MKRVWILMASLLIGVSWAEGQEPAPLNLGLQQAEQLALSHASQVRIGHLDVAATEAEADSHYAQFWPHLSLEAGWQYASEVGELELTLPMVGTQAISFGDHVGYRIGASAAWTLWDSGRVYHQWQAMEEKKKSKQHALTLTKQQVVLETRLAYFRTQLAVLQQALLTESLALARRQYQDIQAKQAAGLSSTMDSLASKLDVLARQQQLAAAQAEVAAASRTLLDKIGQRDNQDLTAPTAIFSGNRQPDNRAMVLILEPIETTRSDLASAQQQQLDNRHPGPVLFNRLAALSGHLGSSIGAAHWPTVQLTGRSGLEYPNGPVQESVYQNRASINAGWVLFKGGQVSKLEKQKKMETERYSRQADQKAEELKLQWLTSQDRLKVFRTQEKLFKQTIAQTQKLAELSYSAYQAGQVDYLNVQQANLNVLEAQAGQARIKVEQLIQLAVLDQLADKKVRDQ